jgi:hypothetical protein
VLFPNKGARRASRRLVTACGRLCLAAFLSGISAATSRQVQRRGDLVGVAEGAGTGCAASAVCVASAGGAT